MYSHYEVGRCPLRPYCQATGVGSTVGRGGDTPVSCGRLGFSRGGCPARRLSRRSSSHKTIPSSQGLRREPAHLISWWSLAAMRALFSRVPLGQAIPQCRAQSYLAPCSAGKLPNMSSGARSRPSKSATVGGPHRSAPVPWPDSNSTLPPLPTNSELRAQLEQNRKRMAAERPHQRRRYRTPDVTVRAGGLPPFWGIRPRGGAKYSPNAPFAHDRRGWGTRTRTQSSRRM